MTGRATFEVASAPEGVAEARKGLTEAATGRVDERTLETARLLTSELVTNGIRHGAAEEPILVAVRIADANVRVEVTDSGEGFAPRPGEGRDDLGGWGLFLVEELSTRWGIIRNGHTRVWFELGDRLN
jgi:anti-sigma regulatory factor (Ser/Thr protein kinase)